MAPNFVLGCIALYQIAMHSAVLSALFQRFAVSRSRSHVTLHCSSSLSALCCGDLRFLQKLPELPRLPGLLAHTASVDTKSGGVAERDC